MRIALLGLAAAHSVISLGVLAGIVTHAWHRTPIWMPEVGTLMVLAAGAIAAAPLLGVFIAIVCRPPESWTPALLALRERAGRRMKRLLMVIGFSFIAGGLLTPVYDLSGEVFHGLRLISWCLMGSSVALLVIVTPWIAIYSRTFDVHPNE